MLYCTAKIIKKKFLFIVLALSGLNHIVSYCTDTRYWALHDNCCTSHTAKHLSYLFLTRNYAAVSPHTIIIMYKIIKIQFVLLLLCIIIFFNKNYIYYNFILNIKGLIVLKVLLNSPYYCPILLPRINTLRTGDADLRF